jgi:hypothetical protein
VGAADRIASATPAACARRGRARAHGRAAPVTSPESSQRLLQAWVTSFDATRACGAGRAAHPADRDGVRRIRRRGRTRHWRREQRAGARRALSRTAAADAARGAASARLRVAQRPPPPREAAQRLAGGRFDARPGELGALVRWVAAGHCQLLAGVQRRLRGGAASNLAPEGGLATARARGSRGDASALVQARAGSSRAAGRPRSRAARAARSG